MSGGATVRLVWALAQESLTGSADLIRRHWPYYLLLALVVVALMLTVDRPLALWLYGLPAADKAFFAAINEVGRSGWMFAAAAVVLIAGLVLHRRGLVLRGAYVIGAIAMGGWAINVVKVVAARARPRLLVGDGTYGFQGFAIDADWNSFPSGHSQAIAGLAGALSCIWPRFAPLFLALAVLPAVARAVMLNHFASDVLAGYAAGLTVAIALARAMTARGLVVRHFETDGNYPSQKVGPPGPRMKREIR
ncbi:phosphatase PAP2 family protein [Zavarzinia compransoris]|uniref:phosphatase PAP2 family protein n=1 Tax=Zavarzinia marina TaxID=2911065 RepID=UPI001F3DFB7C|nr:phosphatase PAP2 family protein [Zavarzinia marina]MCF4166552.1 phosphatase PAP2 family protein [Zavarzinia marina]